MDSLRAALIFPLEYVNNLTLIKPERKRRGWSAINGISDRSLGHRFKITDILGKFFFLTETRSPLLGVCILRTTTYWGCGSTVLRGSIESRGIQCIQCALQGKLPLFSCIETGSLKINMVEADLSPTTFTSSSASDSDYDISLRIPLKMKTKTYTLKLPVMIIIRPRKQYAKPKVAGVRRCQSRPTGSSCHPVELIKILKTTYKKWQPVCFRESEEAKGMNKN